MKKEKTLTENPLTLDSLVEVTDKRDGKVKAVIPETDETFKALKKSGLYKFKKIKK